MSKNIWTITDSACNQRYRVINEEKEIYEFQEERVVDPLTNKKEVYSSEMNLSDYDISFIIGECAAFGYSEDEVMDFLKTKEGRLLILECIFELET